jgi:acyl CoA:acetate/3-ketoacid CoA transferase alpha subunit
MAQLLSLRDAVAGLVNDGDTVALGGFIHLIPHAAGHEVIRQGRKDLTLVRMAGPVRFAHDAVQTEPPSKDVLGVLRDLQARTRRAHGEAA